MTSKERRIMEGNNYEDYIVKKIFKIKLKRNNIVNKFAPDLIDENGKLYEVKRCLTIRRGFVEVGLYVLVNNIFYPRDIWRPYNDYFIFGDWNIAFIVTGESVRRNIEKYRGKGILNGFLKLEDLDIVRVFDLYNSKEISKESVLWLERN